MALTLNVNGVDVEVDASSDTPILWVIRDHLSMTGTKFGCGMSLCGACTVHLNGQPIRSCVTPIQAAVGQKITTIEGIESPAAVAIQDAWDEMQVPQCGYCQSGQVMSAVALLERNPNPSYEDIDAAMTGNVCRCATYVRIRNAIKHASTKLS
ncbi:(2Fe-2S)-binding protein [Vibrio maerlii]|uniref:(2Fe-2S)-binding protein n=1 Tax=Vibrio maerlii TaxID=2231648 RepID=UPI000E3C3323|nr:(2Fe-2S)-binding protein [Vibrio maerlii]